MRSFGIGYLNAMGGDAKRAERCPTLKFTINGFVVIAVKIRKRT
jgi:hypothetical protein